MEGRLELGGLADGSASLRLEVLTQANPCKNTPRAERLFEVFGWIEEPLMLSSQEKFLSLVNVARTVNRHRWVG